MAPCFPLPCVRHHHPKLLSFFKPCTLARRRFSGDAEDAGAVHDFDLDRDHVIMLEIRRRAMMKERNRLPSSEQLGEGCRRRWLPMVPSSSEASKIGDVKDRVNVDEDCEEYFSVRSSFSQSSGSGGEECWWEQRGGLPGRTAVGLSEEWFRELEGWPFGLWRRRKVVMLPPLPKSPSDSWTWHKRNRTNGRVWPVWAKTVKHE